MAPPFPAAELLIKVALVETALFPVAYTAPPLDPAPTVLEENVLNMAIAPPLPAAEFKVKVEPESVTDPPEYTAPPEAAVFE
eukprot:1935717-Rhodomonas_salina.1